MADSDGRLGWLSRFLAMGGPMAMLCLANPVKCTCSAVLFQGIDVETLIGISQVPAGLRRSPLASESDIRVRRPCQTSESAIRVSHPSQPSESALHAPGCRADALRLVAAARLIAPEALRARSSVCAHSQKRGRASRALLLIASGASGPSPSHGPRPEPPRSRGRRAGLRKQGPRPLPASKGRALRLG